MDIGYLWCLLRLRLTSRHDGTRGLRTRARLPQRLPTVTGVSGERRGLWTYWPP